MLADHLSAHPDCPGYATVPYYSGVQTRPHERLETTDAVLHPA